ncbi:MAG: tRNA uridine-5-carboxymethylaminomethyl(34) synthesis GTPase MnmE [Puniceicoccales bacterium]|nr:tRNA uridine-5-carboxymethylaminomethyl(34) synthesis GTPase MnmE [Puniceicoccales bacterium]
MSPEDKKFSNNTAATAAADATDAATTDAAAAAATETIVAPATPTAGGALAVLRLSGPLCGRVAKEAFGRTAEPLARRAYTGVWRDTAGAEVDRCVFVFYAAGASYTGEPALEVSCHGNPLIVRRILADCTARGCRLAGPGEFTRRAFANGRLDLSQAEAVADIVNARSEDALAAARRLLAGELGRKVAAWAERLLRTLAGLEAYIDFPEEDLPPETQGGPVAELRTLAGELAATAETAKFAAGLRDGVATVIAGAPNAGKSSLLNALLGEERALVSDEPGTTRDFLSEYLNAGAHRIRITDTAGLRTAAGAGALERRGMELAREQIEKADFCLLAVDAAAPPPELPDWAQAAFAHGRAMLVLNKSDLPANPLTAALLPNLPRAAVSAKTGAGLPELKARLAEVLERGEIVPAGDTGLVVNARHADALRRAAERIGATAELLRDGMPAELAAGTLRDALDALGEITGRAAVENERMLDALFANFCIGK